MKNIKSLAQFKRELVVGTKVTIHNKMKEGQYPQERIVVATQTNGVYTGYEVTPEEKAEKIASGRFHEWNFITLNGVIYNKIFMDYQKASQMSFRGNEVDLLAYETELSFGQKVVAPMSSLTVGKPWLTITVH